MMDVSCGITDRAITVFKLARDVANDCNRADISTVDILFSLVKEGTGIAASHLIHIGFDRYIPGVIYREPLDIPDDEFEGWRDCGMREMRSLTGEAKSMFSISIRQAIICHFHQFDTAVERNARNTYIGTEHLLLGILQSPDCSAFSMLESHLNAIGQSVESLDAGIRYLLYYKNIN